MKKLHYLFCTLLLLSLCVSPAGAVVEIARSGQTPQSIRDVYLQGGSAFMSIDEVLSILRIQGDWDSVGHVYKIRTPRGTAIISPGSHYLRLGENFTPLEAQPRFIDGKLRVSEDFVTRRIPNLIGEAIYYRNLNPQVSTGGSDEDESTIDRLFSFLLRKKKTDVEGPRLRGVALDPGHGGQDVGSITAEGDAEKEITLDVSRRLEKLLKMRLGIPVYTSRTGDYTLSLQERLAPAARPDADALILLHAQTLLSPEPQGVFLYVRPQDEGQVGDILAGEGESMRLATHLKDSLLAAGLQVNGIRRAPLAPLGRGDLPTVLVELGCLSNPEELRRLQNAEGQEQLAEALYRGLKQFADDKKKEST